MSGNEINYILKSNAQQGELFIPKNKKNIVYKNFNNDSIIRKNEVFSADIKKTSIFEGKLVNLTETWVDLDGDGTSDMYIKEFIDPKTKNIIETQKYKSTYHKDAPLENTPMSMKNIVQESDNDYYKNPDKYNHK